MDQEEKNPMNEENYKENNNEINNERLLGFISNINLSNKQSHLINVIIRGISIIFIIEIILHSYIYKKRYFNMSFDDGCVAKDKKIMINKENNKNMKHAILLLSSYGINYLNNFLVQFNNDKRFDIFIHIDGKTKIDIENNKTIINSNIKYYKNIFSATRFSLELGDVMYELLSVANKYYDYDYYHFMSESCYFTDSLDDFYNFFVINNLYSYINYYTDNLFTLNDISNYLYKGSQWMSIHKNLVNKLLLIKDKYNIYRELVKNGTILLHGGAYDEFIIQNLIITEICDRKPFNCKIYNHNLRFIKWYCKRKNSYCPNYLNIDNVPDDEIKYIKRYSFIVRKINYTDPKAMKLIEKLKNYRV